MQQPVHQVGPENSRDFWEAEFAEPPGTVNVKRHSGHTELLWHTDKNLSQMLVAIMDLAEEYPETWQEEIRVDISDLRWDHVNNNSKMIIEFIDQNSVSRSSQILISLYEFHSILERINSPSRCPLIGEDFLILWTKEEEPSHPIVDRGDERGPLPFHLAIRAQNEESITHRIQTLYEKTGEPTATKEAREELMEEILEFIEKPEEYG